MLTPLYQNLGLFDPLPTPPGEAVRYRHSHLKHCKDISGGDFNVYPRWSNAILNGADYGWIMLEHSSGSGEFRVYVYSNATDAQAQTNEICDSGVLDTSALPATIALAEANSSGVAGSILVRGTS